MDVLDSWTAGQELKQVSQEHFKHFRYEGL